MFNNLEPWVRGVSPAQSQTQQVQRNNQVAQLTPEQYARSRFAEEERLQLEYLFRQIISRLVRFARSSYFLGLITPQEYVVFNQLLGIADAPGIALSEQAYVLAIFDQKVAYMARRSSSMGQLVCNLRLDLATLVIVNQRNRGGISWQLN